MKYFADTKKSRKVLHFGGGKRFVVVDCSIQRLCHNVTVVIHCISNLLQYNMVLMWPEQNGTSLLFSRFLGTNWKPVY